jgi:HPt (histidine-containing phosphotransfer) domain-containing protein
VTNLEVLLDTLDKAAATHSASPESARTRNRAGRATYRRQISISIEHPGGGIVKLQVATRNIAPGGMSFLCSTFIHAGSSCLARLLTPHEEEICIEGEVVHCHLVRGRIHEVGIRFKSPIETRGFIVPRLELLESSRGHQPEYAALISAFLAEAGQQAKEIHRALAAGDSIAIRRVCLAIKTGAVSAGYDKLASAVDLALASLANRASAEARPNILRIAAACEALAKSHQQST